MSKFVRACDKVQGVCMSCTYADMCPRYQDMSLDVVYVDSESGEYAGTDDLNAEV